jgi:hypothetical protein
VAATGSFVSRVYRGYLLWPGLGRWRWTKLFFNEIIGLFFPFGRVGKCSYCVAIRDTSVEAVLVNSESLVTKHSFEL